MAAFACSIYDDNEFRQAIERIAPAVYLTTSYHAYWLIVMEQVTMEKGQFSGAELEMDWGQVNEGGA